MLESSNKTCSTMYCLNLIFTSLNRFDILCNNKEIESKEYLE